MQDHVMSGTRSPFPDRPHTMTIILRMALAMLQTPTWINERLRGGRLVGRSDRRLRLICDREI